MIVKEEVTPVVRNKKAEIGKGVQFPIVTPWHESVDGAALLSELVATIRCYIVCDKETAIAVALWCAFTWLIEHVEVAPLAMITAPEKRCGKSQLLNLMGKLVRNPLVASNISPSAVFRVIEAYSPTLLIDEADSFFKDNEELRGVINSGHTRQSAYVIRNVGEKHEPHQFSTWGAKAISGIGNLPDTIMDRAIILTLRRKMPNESVQRLRHAEAGLFERLASKLARFADDAAQIIDCARPALPEALNDRAQDNWEPLLAIADYAGGEWPKIARDAALKLSNVEHDSLSLSAELLADVKEVFEHKGVERISTASLIEALCADDEKSWATYNRGKPITPRQFAKRLKEYGIQSKTVRIDFKTPKGFELEQFSDAFARYLSPTPSSATPPQTTASLNCSVVDRGIVAATDYSSATGKATLLVETLFEDGIQEVALKVLALARQGDLQACRLVIERILPVRKDRPISVNLPEITTAEDAAQAMGAVLAAVANGDMTPLEGSEVTQLIETYLQTLEIKEFDARLRAIEGK
jgi:putative DNA primase/helicase